MNNDVGGGSLETFQILKTTAMVEKGLAITLRLTHTEDAAPSCTLTLTLLTWTVWRAPTNASKWRMGFNSAFKGLIHSTLLLKRQFELFTVPTGC